MIIILPTVSLQINNTLPLDFNLNFYKHVSLMIRLAFRPRILIHQIKRIIYNTAFYSQLFVHFMLVIHMLRKISDSSIFYSYVLSTE